MRTGRRAAGREKRRHAWAVGNCPKPNKTGNPDPTTPKRLQ
nr:MAG TPA: hypothetical protein [Caudoviricetes sp.]